MTESSDNKPQEIPISRARRILYLFVIFVLLSQVHPNGYGNPFDYGANSFRVFVMNMSFSLPAWGLAYFVSLLAKKIDFLLRVIFLVLVYFTFLWISSF